MSAFTRCKFGRKRRLVIAVMCVPMPPCFLGLPLRQMMLPFIGPLPVNSQILAITHALFQGQEGSDPARPRQALFRTEALLRFSGGRTSRAGSSVTSLHQQRQAL